MIVFFNVLALDDKPILRYCLQDRRRILRDLVHAIPGRSMRSEWTLLDFKTGGGITDLKQTFARSLAERQEGLVLKPLHAPYFALLSEQGCHQAGFFVKMKKDYLGDMGGERDLGDFAVVGASFDPQVAPKTDLKPLHWTNFHLGCCINKDAVQRTGAKPRFQVVARLSIDKCIPKSDIKYLNIQGYVRQAKLREDGSIAGFDLKHSRDYGQRTTVAFKKPFIAEILGGGFDKPQDESFEMLRHPRVNKIHHDRIWEDAVTMRNLERMAEEKWEVPDADKLDEHAKDVALLVKQYAREMDGSQATTATDDTTQDKTQYTTQRSSQETPRRTTIEFGFGSMPGATIVEDSQQFTYNTSTSHGSSSRRTQPISSLVSRKGLLTHAKISERLVPLTLPTLRSTASETMNSVLPASSAPSIISTASKRRSATQFISSPKAKRRKTTSPLQYLTGSKNLGLFDFDSQEGIIHMEVHAAIKV